MAKKISKPVFSGEFMKGIFLGAIIAIVFWYLFKMAY